MKRHWAIHLRNTQPLGKNVLALGEFDEVAAAIQIIDDGNGGFTVKNEDDQPNAAPIPVVPISIGGPNKFKGSCECSFIIM